MVIGVETGREDQWQERRVTIPTQKIKVGDLRREIKMRSLG